MWLQIGYKWQIAQVLTLGMQTPLSCLEGGLYSKLHDTSQIMFPSHSFSSMYLWTEATIKPSTGMFSGEGEGAEFSGKQNLIGFLT